MRPAWQEARVCYVVTEKAYQVDVAMDPAGPDGRSPRFHHVPDANKDQKLRLIWLAICMLVTVLRVRPDVVISTGAAPGYFALRFGKMLGARTIWVDSIANAEEMSVSGVLARRWSDLWLTQWPHLAGEQGPLHAGAVM
ncbi:UDP-N-acetylglucosamine--LPS N-acetylglucosamine transferase [Cereibacter sphaeroides]|uniref:UDP-N-acetylglucosamine--LPS N-acetylglucosamine transferase n=1 Tax=Cereibacter sphaeroides TaxID=1063 RepID=UPI001F42D3ED|nr:UDP-N-acetylglucosamine--LPS N-acetylglucosamine transferase [Cereibacter sphaeroides]MCE6950273.1 UDP-N-acetylglucosamine--LPS N-acetylglucosamine transferase [Cereibacter sphaeroides]